MGRVGDRWGGERQVEDEGLDGGDLHGGSKGQDRGSEAVKPQRGVAKQRKAVRGGQAGDDLAEGVVELIKRPWMRTTEPRHRSQGSEDVF